MLKMSTKKNSQPFGKNVRKPQGGDFLTHTVGLLPLSLNLSFCLCYIIELRPVFTAFVCLLVTLVGFVSARIKQQKHECSVTDQIHTICKIFQAAMKIEEKLITRIINYRTKYAGTHLSQILQYSTVCSILLH